MELALDEFVVDQLFSGTPGEIKNIIAIISMMKLKCHKAIFTSEHLDRFRNKLRKYSKVTHDQYVKVRMLPILTEFLADQDRVAVKDIARVKNGSKKIPEDDVPVVESALASRDKILVTTDSKLKERLEEKSITSSLGLRILNPIGLMEMLAS